MVGIITISDVDGRRSGVVTFLIISKNVWTDGVGVWVCAYFFVVFLFFFFFFSLFSLVVWLIRCCFHCLVSPASERLGKYAHTVATWVV